MYTNAPSSNRTCKRLVQDSPSLEQRDGKAMQPPVAIPYQAMANAHVKKKAIATGMYKNAPIQRYRQTNDGAFNISENERFAVSNKEKYPKHLFIAEGEDAPLSFPDRLAWDEKGTRMIEGNKYTDYLANISEYAENTGKDVANEHCGRFARDITQNNAADQGEDRSVGAPGNVLKYGETSPGKEEGWENHFATVVKRDDGDHATYETAVGITDSWVGIYGVNRGQTFKYKTQWANLERLENRPPILMQNNKPTVKSFWDYVCCRSGKKPPDIVIKMGISHEEAEQYRQELVDWRDKYKEPASAFMKRVVPQLNEELRETGGD